MLDADSFLTRRARSLPATMLAWHYRSRYESLISFSATRRSTAGSWSRSRTARCPRGHAARVAVHAPRRRPTRSRPPVDALLERPHQLPPRWSTACTRSAAQRRRGRATSPQLVRELLRRETGLEHRHRRVLRGAAGARSKRALERAGREDADVRRAARGRVRARGGRPVRRPVREEPGERPGRRARHHHPERLLRAAARTAGC